MNPCSAGSTAARPSEYTQKGKMMRNRDNIINALAKSAAAGVERHRMNVEVLLSNPVGVSEHPDIMDTIEGELDMMEKYISRQSILKVYFEKGDVE